MILNLNNKVKSFQKYLSLLHFLSLDWLEQFLNIHHKTLDYPTFGIMKMNEMSHDYLERLFWIDYDLKNFFENLFQNNLLNNTSNYVSNTML